MPNIHLIFLCLEILEVQRRPYQWYAVMTTFILWFIMKVIMDMGQCL